MTIEEIEEKANPGWFSGEDIKVLVNEVKDLKPGDVYLEIGVDRGRSLSVARMVTDPGVAVCGVDIQADPKVPGTVFTQGDSTDVANNMAPFSKRINVLLIDGDHTHDGCRRDIEAWLPYMKDNGVILFHDFDETSPGVIWAVGEFTDKKRKLIKEFRILKRTDSNTSLARIKL